MKRLTLDELIPRFRSVHGEKYDYSKIVYINMHKKVIIGCPTHGEFLQTPMGHLKCGCYFCGREISVKRRQSLTFDEFVLKSRNVHNNFYDYSLVNYKNNHTKVKIVCPLHGVFEHHSQGKGYAKYKSALCELDYSKNGRSFNVILYFVKLWDEFEEFYKIGITSFENISKRYDFKVISKVNKTLVEAKFEELKFLENFKNFSIFQIKKKFMVTLNVLAPKFMMLCSEV